MVLTEPPFTLKEAEIQRTEVTVVRRGLTGGWFQCDFLPYCSALFHSGVGDWEAFVNFCKPSLRDLVVLASSKVREAQGAGRLECSRRTGLLLQVKSLRAAHSHQ